MGGHECQHAYDLKPKKNTNHTEAAHILYLMEDSSIGYRLCGRGAGVENENGSFKF
jgi:hypothetical protein